MEVDLIDCERYQYNGDEGEPSLHPDDVALMDDIVSDKRKLLMETAVPWLQKTSYISTESKGLGRGHGGNHVPLNKMLEDKGKAKQAEEAELTEEQKRIQEIEAIELTFDTASDIAAGTIPKHPLNPALTATEVLPVLPDGSNWMYKYAQGIYDVDAAPEKRTDLSKIKQREYTEQVVLVTNETEKGLIGRLYLPVDDTFAVRKRRRDAADADASGNETTTADNDYILVGEQYGFTHIRDYQMDVKVKKDTREETFFFSRRRTDENGGSAVFYNELQGKVKLNRCRTDGKPRKLTVSHRDWTDEEKDAQDLRNHELESSGDEYEGGMVDGDVEAEAVDEATDNGGVARVNVNDGDGTPDGGGTPIDVADLSGSEE